MIEIDGREFGPGNVCIVAEISCNHNGSITLARRLIESAKKVGADFVKLQCYTPDELLMLRGDGPAPEPWADLSMRDLYEKAQTPHDWFRILTAGCRDQGIPWFSSVFGLRSLMLLEDLGCPAYKIAALDCDSGMLAAASLTGKPTIVSRRGTFRRGPEDVALYCPPGYPQDSEMIRRRYSEHHVTHLQVYDGLSYHGVDPGVPVEAVEHGAQMIEAHLQLRDEPSDLEADFALDEHQFADMMQMIRAAEVLA